MSRAVALPAREARAPSLRLRRIALVAGLLAASAATGYWFWFRDSSLVAVNKVEVVGARSADAERVRRALVSAGRDMTTLHVRDDALRDAVRAYPAVRSVSVEAHFPSALTIRVVEYDPVAVVGVRRRAVGVGADGAVLRGIPIEGRLPAVGGPRPATRSLSGQQLDVARMLGAAPVAIRRDLKRGYSGKGGLTVELRRGGKLRFGDARDLAAKWAAAARLLADPRLEGFAYIDLRVPSRPAVGGAKGKFKSTAAVTGTKPRSDEAARLPAATGAGRAEAPSATPDAAVPDPTPAPSAPAEPKQTDSEAAPAPADGGVTGGGAAPD